MEPNLMLYVASYADTDAAQADFTALKDARTATSPSSVRPS